MRPFWNLYSIAISPSSPDRQLRNDFPQIINYFVLKRAILKFVTSEQSKFFMPDFTDVNFCSTPLGLVYLWGNNMSTNVEHLRCSHLLGNSDCTIRTIEEFSSRFISRPRYKYLHSVEIPGWNHPGFQRHNGLHNYHIFVFTGHSEICRLRAVEEIPQKNGIFPEFLRLLRQISGGQWLFAYFLVGQKVGPGRENLDFLVLFYQEKRT